MDFDAVLHWLQDLSLPTAIRENDNLFPWFESVHVLAIVVVVGSISIVDLRLLGIASRDRPVGRLLHDVLRITWGAFAVALIAGSLLFSARAIDYAHNFYFQGKMVLMALATTLATAPVLQVLMPSTVTEDESGRASSCHC